MNLPVLSVAIIMSLALLVHLFIGTRETASLEPHGKGGKAMAHWVQAMCAFQMLTVDFVFVTGALYWLALWDVGILARPLTLVLAGYFAVQGIVWLGQILWFQRPGVTILSLPHWAVWFAFAALLWVGVPA